jgi:hypothetical protein
MHGEDEGEQRSQARPRWRAFVPVVVKAGILIALFAAALSQMPDDMVYVPDAKALQGHEFIVEGSEVRGIYGNRDVPSQVFSYHTTVPTDADLIRRLEERILPRGWARASDVDGAHCYRLKRYECRFRLDPVARIVFVGDLSDVSPSEEPGQTVNSGRCSADQLRRSRAPRHAAASCAARPRSPGCPRSRSDGK